ncbi:MAG: hypothetical protein MJY57_00670 [Bacteroidales bacterium]|nr:hypothetical protein [Bacteroidales bacterium]
MMEENKTFKLGDILTFIKNSIPAILRGEFLFRLKVDRFLPHIAWLFFLFAMIIWASLAIEGTMAEVEKNKAILRELEISNAQKTYEVVSLTRRSTVEEMLQDMGSDVKEAEKRATVLKK